MANVYHKDLTGADLHVPKVHNNTYHSETYLTTVSEHGADKHTNRTRNIWIPVNYSPDMGVYNSEVAGGYLIDNDSRSAFGSLYVPSDYVSGGVITAVVISEASGNLYYYINAVYAANNEDYNTHTAIVGPITEAVLGGKYEMLETTLSLTSLNAGDLMSIYIIRFAADPSDTINANVFAIGFIFTYTADM